MMTDKEMYHAIYLKAIDLLLPSVSVEKLKDHGDALEFASSVYRLTNVLFAVSRCEDDEFSSDGQYIEQDDEDQS